MQQGGGSPFRGPPPLEIGGTAYPEAAAPISVRAPPSSSGFDDLGAQGADEEHDMANCAPGNRWPRQETLALLKIRSDMDAAFRDATLKGPLWEEVSRKLAELGYHRSAKKCKEKFENVHKYYKRTKEGRSGRQDGKSYRFFSQLEALKGSTTSAAAPFSTEISLPAPTPVVARTGADPAYNNAPCGPSARPQQSPVLSTVPATAATIPTIAVAAPPSLASVAAPATILVTAPHPLALAELSFSSNTSSYSGTESDDEDQEVEELGGGGERKRKREEGGGGGEGSKYSRKLMAFFEGLMKQVIERQEAMQQRFLEAIEQREHDRMIREEAWRRQEITRISREHDLAAQERAAAASRDAAIIAFLQKLTGQPIPIPPPPQPTPTSATTVPVALASPTQAVPPPPALMPQPQKARQAPPTSTEIVPIILEPLQPLEVPQDPQSARGEGGFSTAIDLASSRWPKSEVHALIELRSEMEARYQECGPKGPLWEEISAGMGRLGYNRSAKRCKEKWENINKYFKKVKEGNKKRPEDAKTCPYFHQLDALYRNKLLSNTPALPGPSEPEFNSSSSQSKLAEYLTVMVPPARQQADTGKPEDRGSNGGHPSGFLHECSSSSMVAPKTPEDIVKKLMVQQHMVEPESNNMEEDNVDEDDEDDDENGDMQFRIQYQRPRVGGSGGATGAAGENNFLAMVR